MNLLRHSRSRFIAPFALLLFTIVSIQCGGDDDDAVDNATCEANCAANYRSEASGCASRANACLESCASPDDIPCVWDCEDLEFECFSGFAICSGGCECAQVVVDCAQGCDSNDTQCLTDCAQSYADCAGTDSPYLCVVDCDTSKSLCTSNCEDTSTTMDEFLSCRSACATQHDECLGGCG